MASLFLIGLPYHLQGPIFPLTRKLVYKVHGHYMVQLDDISETHMRTIDDGRFMSQKNIHRKSEILYIFLI